MALSTRLAMVNIFDLSSQSFGGSLSILKSRILFLENEMKSTFYIGSLSIGVVSPSSHREPLPRVKR